MSTTDYTQSDKNRARYQTKRALEIGLLHRNDDCEDCGAPTCDCHHLDYSNPLAVVWLCRECHSYRHRRIANDPSFPEIKARLALLNSRDLAFRWATTPNVVTRVIRGFYLRSPLLPLVAYRIKVLPNLLRSYFIDLAAQRNGHQAA